MKNKPLINRDISDVVASMGHTDTITLCDAGLPIPDSVRRIDLAVRRGLPQFFEVLETVLEELKVQKIYIAEEMEKASPAVYNRLLSMFDKIDIVKIPHEEFKLLTHKSKAIVRTGECTPYANIILESDVAFEVE